MSLYESVNEIVSTTMKTGIFIVCMLILIDNGVTGYTSTKLMPEDRRILDKLLSNDFSLPPFYDTGNRTDITMAIVFSGMRVSDKADVQLSFYLYQSWNDPRLVLPCINCDTNHSFPQTHTVAQKYWKNIWMSEIYIENTDTTQYHDSIMPNRFVWLLTNGTVYHGMRLDLKTHCKFGRMVFPVAKYVCNLKFRIHSYDITEVLLEWLHTRDMTFIAGFNEGSTQMTKYQKRHCIQDFTSIQNSACLELIVHIEKNLQQNFLRLYMPSVFIILTGWLSFWVDRREVSARVKFGTLCVLAMITEDAGINFLMADDIQSSALDVWFAVCLIFSTLVPVEFVVVHVVDKYQKAIILMEEGKKGKTECNHGAETSVNNQILQTSTLACSFNTISCYELHQLHCTMPNIKYEFVKGISSGEIEKKFRVIYAISFVVFVLFYWCFYLNYEEEI